MSSNRFPDFFIVGAAKAGTSSLWYYLRQHPEIFMVKDIKYKELGYFANGHGIENEQEYKAFFNSALENQIIGESCNSYLTAPESATRIKEAVPHAKIMISLRNPVDRSFSLFNWMRANGYEKLTDFRAALKAEGKRKTNENFDNSHGNLWHYLYFNSGLYSSQIQRYVDVFGKENCLFLTFDELSVDPLKVCSTCFTFLNVGIDFIPEVKIINKAKQLSSQKLQYFIKSKLPKLRKQMKLPKGLLGNMPQKVMNLNQKEGKNTVVMDSDLREVLKEKYRVDIKLTSQIINKDLSKWLK